jgi:hypothetical protein
MVFYTAILPMTTGQISGYLIILLTCLTLGGSRTSDNLDKFASNDGLTGTVVQDLELVDHVSSVLGGVLEYMCQRGDLNYIVQEYSRP